MLWPKELNVILTRNLGLFSASLNIFCSNMSSWFARTLNVFVIPLTMWQHSSKRSSSVRLRAEEPSSSQKCVKVLGLHVLEEGVANRMWGARPAAVNTYMSRFLGARQPWVSGASGKTALLFWYKCQRPVFVSVSSSASLWGWTCWSLKESLPGLTCYHSKSLPRIVNPITSKFILEEALGFRKRRRICSNEM